MSHLHWDKQKRKVAHLQWDVGCNIYIKFKHIPIFSMHQGFSISRYTESTVYTVGLVYHGIGVPCYRKIDTVTVPKDIGTETLRYTKKLAFSIFFWYGKCGISVFFSTLTLDT